MKEYLKYLLSHLKSIILFFFVGFLFSFIIINYVNKERAYYLASFEVSNIETFEDSKLTNEDFLTSIRDSASKYSAIEVDKMLAKDGFSYTINSNEITIKTGYKYYETFFLSSSNSLATRAKMFIKDSVLAIDENVTFTNSKDIVTLYNYLNPWLIALYGSLVCLVIILIVCIFLSKKSQQYVIEEYHYDNITMFSTIFHKKYFSYVFRPLTKVKEITTLAMLFALMIACKFIPIPSGFGNLGISFTYLFFSIIAMIYGPLYGFVIGALSDIIGFFINSGGGSFSFLYTLQSALTGVIYGLCFFRRKFSFTRAFIARLLVNYLINVVMGSFLFIWTAYGHIDEVTTLPLNEFLVKVKYYMLLLSLPKNTIYLLPQSLLLYYVVRAILPILVRFKVVSKDYLPLKKMKRD